MKSAAHRRVRPRARRGTTTPGDPIPSRDLFRFLIESTSDMIGILEADGTIRYQSPSVQRVLGYAPEQLIGRDAFDLVHPDEVEAARRTFHRRLSLPGVAPPIELRMRHADGSWRVLEVVANTLLQKASVAGVLVTSRDVTARRRAEEALRTAQERLHAVVSGASIILFACDCAGRLTFAEGTRLDAIGIPPFVPPGPSLFELYPNSPRLKESVERALAGEAFADIIEFGSFVWSVQYGPLRDPSGAVTGAVGVATDVTKADRAERKTSVLLEIARSISGTLDLHDLLERVQRRIAAVLPCEIVATFQRDAVAESIKMTSQHGLSAELLPVAHALAFAPEPPGSPSPWAGQTLVLNDSAEQPWIAADLVAQFGMTALVAVPLRVRDNDLGWLAVARTTPGAAFDRSQVDLCEGIAGQLAVAIEMTALFQTQQEEAQVSAAHARVGRALIASLDSTLLIERLCAVTTEVLECDASYTVLMNPERDAFLPVTAYGESRERWESIRVLRFPRALVGERIARLDREEILNLDHCAPGATVPDTIAIQHGIAAAMYMGLRRGGEIIGVLCATYRQPGRRFTRLHERIARGIAQLASLALETARLIEKLDQANRLKSDFVATMSHELRTPLNVIIGYTDLLLEGSFGPLAHEQTEVAHRVERSAQELLELINATLDLGRLEAGRLPIELQEVHLPELISELNGEIHTPSEKSGLTLAWSVAPGLPVLVSDPLKLKVILKNLIGNSVKFTPQGTVAVDVAACDGGVEFRVSDTGVGISPQALPFIFEAFRQGDGSMSRRYGGVGLGLYIVRRLLDVLGGAITVESEVDRGSTFTVRLPLTAQRSALT